MKQKKKSWFRVTDALSLQFLLFHVWWIYCQFSWGRVHPCYPNTAYQLCVFVEASCWVHDISGRLQSHPISKLRLEFQTKLVTKQDFLKGAGHSYNVEISDSCLSTLLNPFLDRHNCKVIFIIISVTLVGGGKWNSKKGDAWWAVTKLDPNLPSILIIFCPKRLCSQHSDTMFLTKWVRRHFGRFSQLLLKSQA